MNITQTILSYGRAHRRSFWLGVAAALMVVACRLALPWPIKAIVQPWMNGGGPPPDWAAIGWIGGAFVLLAVGLGLADLVVRLQFARYSIGLVKDMRSDAFDSIRRRDPTTSGTGDLVARLIGDTARMKAGIKGFLVHVASNTVLLVGVTGVLLWLYLPMGAVFGLACVALLAVTGWGALVTYRRAVRYRSNEGMLAEHIHDAVAGDADVDAFDSLNDDSSSAEASLTRTQGRATWAAHALFGVATLSALVVCVRGVTAGGVDASTLIAVALYAMLLRAPMVQLVRQGTRTGKIAACLERVADLIDTDLQDVGEPFTLNDRLVIDNLRLRNRRALGRTRAVQIDHLEIPAGSRTAIVGKGGSGKSVLLGLLAGRLRPDRGRVLLDGRAIDGVGHAVLTPSGPRWRRRRIGDIVGAHPAAGVDAEALDLLAAVGGKRLVSMLGNGLETKVASSELSLSERRAVMCVRALLSDAPLVLFDDFTADVGSNAAARRWKAVLSVCAGRTVIATFRRSPPEGLFDRVIELRKAKVRSDSLSGAPPAGSEVGVG